MPTTIDDTKTTPQICELKPVTPSIALRTRRRRLADGRFSENVNQLGKLRAWAEGLPGYMPATWAQHQLRLSRNAITLAVYRGFVRSESFTCADGTKLQLVNVQDVARIGRRGPTMTTMWHQERVERDAAEAARKAEQRAARKARAKKPGPRTPARPARQRGSKAKGRGSGARAKR